MGRLRNPCNIPTVEEMTPKKMGTLSFEEYKAFLATLRTTEGVAYFHAMHKREMSRMLARAERRERLELKQRQRTWEEEKDALLQERDALLQDRDVLLQDRQSERHQRQIDRCHMATDIADLLL